LGWCAYRKKKPEKKSPSPLWVTRLPLVAGNDLSHEDISNRWSLRPPRRRGDDQGVLGFLRDLFRAVVALGAPV